MNTNNSKAKIINSDDLSYHSFNAYRRPKKIENSEYSTGGQIRVINLDPTNDPDKVCEAYRQIAIAAQNKRIVKNRQKFKEENEKALLAVEKSRLAAEKRAAKNAAAQAKKFSLSAMGVRRKELIEGFSAGKFKVSPISDKSARAKVGKDIAALRTEGYDIVAITTLVSNRDGNTKEVGIYSLNNFTSYPSYIPGSNVKKAAELADILQPYFEKGLLISVGNVLSAPQLVSEAISHLRTVKGLPVCLVRNRRVESQGRGWILPSKANNLVGNEF